MKLTLTVLALTISANVINDGDALEPSVLNEIDHALAIAPVLRPGECAVTTNSFLTNGLSASAAVIRIVSRQKADGRWLVNGTNCTAEAVAALKALSGIKEDRHD